MVNRQLIIDLFERNSDDGKISRLINGVEIPSRISLLGSSVKVRKGLAAANVLTKILYLMPGMSSGFDLCPSSTPSCRACCLGLHSGRMAMGNVRNSQRWKTALFLLDRNLFFRIIESEIKSHLRVARKHGLTPAVRLDGASDLGLQSEVWWLFPDVMFYDYTKIYDRAMAWASRKVFKPNTHYTFSFSGRNMIECFSMLKAGVNVAVPFDARRGENLPGEWYGHEVLDGDLHDHRPLDPPGKVIGLRWKGPLHLKKMAIQSGWLQSVPGK